jgi:hypothetical protein
VEDEKERKRGRDDSRVRESNGADVVSGKTWRGVPGAPVPHLHAFSGVVGISPSLTKD